MTLVNEQAHILSNDEVGPNLYVMKLASPHLAASIEPGQFVHMKIPTMDEHLLRRPFSIYARDVDAGTMEILYQVVGFGTEHMAGLTVQDASANVVELIGPIGKTWQPEQPSRALLVGGGVGAAPLFMLAEQLVQSGIRTDVVLGAQTEAALVCRDRFEMLMVHGAPAGCMPPRYATDDGSFGLAGFCTSLVEEALAQATTHDAAYDYVAVCGPEPLLKIVAGMCAESKVRCEVSMERRMACGVGACLSCVVDTVEGRKRACVDGPIFDAQKVMW